MKKHYFIVAGGPPSSLRKLLATRYPTVRMEDCLFLGVDAGAVKIMEEKIPLYVAMGDFDSIDETTFTKIQSYATYTVCLPPEKDDTDLESCLKWLMQHEQDRLIKADIHLVDIFGGRVDHELSALWIGLHEEFQPLVPQLIFENQTNQLRYFKAGRYVIERDAKMNYVSFVSLTPVNRLTLAGVKYPLREIDLAFPRAFVSNEFIEQAMELSFDKGLIMMIQSKDE